MDKGMITAVQGWLQAIMPSVAGTLIENFPPEELSKLSKTQGVQGPFSLSLKEFRAPVEGVNFYFMFAGDSLMLAVTADIADAKEGFKPELKFDMFFPIADFATSLSDDQHIQQLVDIVLEQYEEAYWRE